MECAGDGKHAARPDLISRRNIEYSSTLELLIQPSVPTSRVALQMICTWWRQQYLCMMVNGLVVIMHVAWTL